jgi:two-component system, response regulator PdtaR
MPRYFFDLTGTTINYRDDDGTELPETGLIRDEAFRFLASIFRDLPSSKGEDDLAVNVRDESDHVIFTTTLSLRSNWRDSRTVKSKRTVVLLVEDEFLARINAAEAIEEAGFEVVEARNADEAVAVLESRPDVQIVFTDIRMPGAMDGLKLARFIREKWPPTQIIATSGHYNPQEGDLPEGGVFVQKPYSPEALSRALEHFAGNPH